MALLNTPYTVIGLNYGGDLSHVSDAFDTFGESLRRSGAAWHEWVMTITAGVPVCYTTTGAAPVVEEAPAIVEPRRGRGIRLR